MLLLCILIAVQASSESSPSSSSESSNDVSSVQARSESEASSESEICSALRITLAQATDARSIDVATLLANASLTSLSDQLRNFRQRVSTGDVTSVQDITIFVAQLREAVEEVFETCCLDFSLIQNLIQNAFDNLLQDLINGYCFAFKRISSKF